MRLSYTVARVPSWLGVFNPRQQAVRVMYHGLKRPTQHKLAPTSDSRSSLAGVSRPAARPTTPLAPRKGETGYRILGPVTRKVTVDRHDSEDTEWRVVGFRVVTVFDITQTEGEPLPDIGPRLLTGSGNAHLLEAGISMIEEAGYEYSLAPLRGPNGVTRPGTHT